MGKRKNRQPDVVDNANGSNNVQLSESSEEASIGDSKCPHVSKALQCQTVRKILKNKGISNTCDGCKSPNSNHNKENDEEGFVTKAPSLFICLRCGNQACGDSMGNHALGHFKTDHSDSHCLAIDFHSQNVYCYECQTNVNPGCKKQLFEIVEFIKKMSVTMPAPSQPAIPLPPIVNITSDTSITNYKTDKHLSSSNFTKVGGLINFGNTCFFNSVLQCLAQTPYLVKVLQDLREPGEKFILPGGRLKLANENNDENDEQILPPIEGSLEGWADFTSILCKTLVEMQNSTVNKLYRPSELLNSFKKKTSQCMDGGQHDSHELLRHLLELVRNEDLKRYQAIILKEIGLNDKIKRQNADSMQIAHVKFYGNQASTRLLGPEPAFRGVLVSTLQCQQCKHTSHRTEPFLDLSLPVMVDKPQPPIAKRKNCGVEDNDIDIMNINSPLNSPPSKFQSKKKTSGMKYKNNRRHRNKAENSNNNEDSSLTNNSIVEENQENNGGEINLELDDESDADIEDNTEGEAIAMPDVVESGYSSEKTSHPSPTELSINNPLISSVTKSKTFSDADTDECRSSPEIEQPIRGPSSIINDIGEVTSELSKVSISNSRILASSPTRYPTVEGEFSIQSCLNQFAALELMTGSNKVGCEACTARENKKNPDNKSSKMICTPSTKQYLISRVPPILILHLKRFQSQRFGGFRKVTKHVTFPMTLDLAPVCKNHKKPKLYSLFGLVVHSGSLHSGHYVAYVKARPPLNSDDGRWSFLPKQGAIENENGKLSDNSDTEYELSENVKDTVESSPGQWYYISDSSVETVDEASVLKQEAYLLFYERIL